VAGSRRILEARYFGLFIGVFVFVLLSLLSFQLNVIRNVEENLFLDVYFNWKVTSAGRQVQEGATIKAQNPFISPDILIVGIDNRSLQQFGRWPFPRSVHASLINGFGRIRDQGQRERALFLDINFIEPDLDAPENDALLINAMKENGRVFIDTFLQPGEYTGSLAEDYFARQKVLMQNYGEVTNIRGDTTDVVTFLGVEAPLKPYGRATRGYGNASYVEDVDNVFRRQPLVARLAELSEEIDLDALTPDYQLEDPVFDRLAWQDKDGLITTIEYPLTARVLADLRREMTRNAPGEALDTNNDGTPDSYRYRVRRYRDHFIPSVTLALALEYFNKELSDVEVVVGEHIRIAQPELFNVETQTWEPYKLLVRPAQVKIRKDADGNPQPVQVADAVYRVMDEILIPIDERATLLINYMGPRSSDTFDGYQTFPVRPYTGYARDPGIDPGAWPRTKAVANKILMAGIFATGLAEDEKPTPYGLMYGVEINANALNTILMNRYLVEAPIWVEAFVLFGIVMIVSFLTSRSSTIISLVVTIVLILAFFIAVASFFDLASYVLTFSGPALGGLLAFLAIVAYRVVTEEKDKRRIKSMFGKYVSPAVVNEMLQHPPELGGVDKELTVFFSDIRGFTTLSESMSPQELVNHLNVYLTAMTDIILEYRGTLDKYVGDEIMCFWGAPLPQEDHALLACKCALQQMQALRRLNSQWPTERQINIGIGLNSGIMTVGNMGSQGRMNYTLTGDNVNLGARLEGTNKQYLTNVIISEFTYGLVQDKVVARDLDVIRVKGKNKPVAIYELVDMVDGL
jgi:adenylate cyclase